MFLQNEHSNIVPGTAHCPTQMKLHSGVLKRMNMKCLHKGGSRAAATSKIEHFVTIVNGWKPLTIITKRSILDVAAALDQPLYHEIFARAIRLYYAFQHACIWT